MRVALVEKEGKLSIRRQCELLGVNRNRLQGNPEKGVTCKDLDLARIIDEVHLSFPEFGARRMSAFLKRERLSDAGRYKVANVMRKMGVGAIYSRPRTSIPAEGHRHYPYLLRGRKITEADEVWCTDITYIPMKRGFAYLVAIMDWHTRAVLSWRLSNTLETRFCVDALQEALQRSGKSPKIFNTDQGRQFTSQQWIEAVEGAGIQVSMYGKGRWMDNVFIERLWRSVKHEGVYLWAYENLHDLEKALNQWFIDYNHHKPHQALDYKSPWQCYRPNDPRREWRQAA